MPQAIMPSVVRMCIKRWTRGSFKCAIILVHGVDMKVRQALMRLHKGCLIRTEKWFLAFLVQEPNLGHWIATVLTLDLEC